MIVRLYSLTQWWTFWNDSFFFWHIVFNAMLFRRVEAVFSFIDTRSSFETRVLSLSIKGYSIEDLLWRRTQIFVRLFIRRTYKGRLRNSLHINPLSCHSSNFLISWFLGLKCRKRPMMMLMIKTSQVWARWIRLLGQSVILVCVVFTSAAWVMLFVMRCSSARTWRKILPRSRSSCTRSLYHLNYICLISQVLIFWLFINWVSLLVVVTVARCKLSGTLGTYIVPKRSCRWRKPITLLNWLRMLMIAPFLLLQMFLILLMWILPLLFQLLLLLLELCSWVGTTEMFLIASTSPMIWVTIGRSHPHLLLRVHTFYPVEFLTCHLLLLVAMICRRVTTLNSVSAIHYRCINQFEIFAN